MKSLASKNICGCLGGDTWSAAAVFYLRAERRRASDSKSRQCWSKARDSGAHSYSSYRDYFKQQKLDTRPALNEVQKEKLPYLGDFPILVPWWRHLQWHFKQWRWKFLCFSFILELSYHTWTVTELQNVLICFLSQLDEKIVESCALSTELESS